MSTLVLTIGAMGTIMFIMAIGAMVTGRCLRGSCGGVPGPDCQCEKARNNSAS